MARKIILDCDPGIDDAMAIAYAVGSAGIELAGITTVAGNVGLDKTTANALRLRDFLGAPAVPVTAGAADYIVETVMAAPGEITLVAVGPLTNIALALRREPALAAGVRDFVIMGGSTTRGNVTPAAEFNIAVDPEAAAEVFAADWTVTMVGLDVTLQARAHPEILTRLGALGALAERLLLPCLRRYTADPGTVDPGTVDPGTGDQGETGTGEPAVHDVCAVAYVAHPDLLGCVPARVEIETEGRWTAGMTVTDFRAPPQACNALVATTIDVPAFWESVHEAYARIAAKY